MSAGGAGLDRTAPTISYTDFNIFQGRVFVFEWLLRRSCEIYRYRIRTDQGGFPVKSVRLVIGSQIKVFALYNNNRRYPSITVADSMCHNYIRPYYSNARNTNDSH